MIELQNINKTFITSKNEVRALQDIDLQIEDGDICGIIGFSGAGKSTLVRCINLLETPDTGEVIVDGQNLRSLSKKELREQRRKIGMIFQHFNLMPSRTIKDNVLYPLKKSGLSKAEKELKAFKLLELVELSDKADAYPHQLSGGQKQRAAIARALANDPKILLCDEATSALDPITTQSILRLLKKVHDELGLTMVVITHQMDVVKEICTHAAVMEKGRIIERGQTFEIFANPKQEATRSFLMTATNLQKIDDLIDKKDEVAELRPNQTLARLTFLENSVNDSILYQIALEFGLAINILFADIEYVQSHPIGGSVVIFDGKDDQVDRALARLEEKGIRTEVLKRG